MNVLNFIMICFHIDSLAKTHCLAFVLLEQDLSFFLFLLLFLFLQITNINELILSQTHSKM